MKFYMGPGKFFEVWVLAWAFNLIFVKLVLYVIF